MWFSLVMRGIASSIKHDHSKATHQATALFEYLFQVLFTKDFNMPSLLSKVKINFLLLCYFNAGPQSRSTTQAVWRPPIIHYQFLGCETRETLPASSIRQALACIEKTIRYFIASISWGIIRITNEKRTEQKLFRTITSSAYQETTSPQIKGSITTRADQRIIKLKFYKEL